MLRASLHEGLIIAATMGVVTMRPAKLRSTPFKIDDSDPTAIIVWIAHDLAPTERASALDAIDADIRAILRRRRRAGLAPVAELEDEDDDPLDLAVGNDGELGPQLSVVRG